MDFITRNPSSDEVFVSPHEPKPYFVFHPLFQYSRMMEDEDDEQEEEEEKVSAELTLAPASSTSYAHQVSTTLTLRCTSQYIHQVSTTLTLGCTSQCPQCVHGVSTTPTLGCTSPFRYPNSRRLPPLVVNNIKQETEEEEEEESWKIRKTLTTGDLRNTCRFLETKSSLANHLLRYWNYEFVERVLGINKQGCQSCSSRLQYEFKPKIECQVLEELPQFPSQWLKDRDEIGLDWDAPTSRFMFSVLRRADQILDSLGSKEDRRKKKKF